MTVPFSHVAHLDRDALSRSGVDFDALEYVLVHQGSLAVSGGRIARFSSAEALDREGASGAESTRAYLGILAGNRIGAAFLDGDQPVVAGCDWVPLRGLVGELTLEGPSGEGEVELAMTAAALGAWHVAHPRCARCGHATVPVQAGWVRRCERCEKEHFPRTDPAIIVAITDADDRLLLAHAAGWSPRRFSHLAGFLEPGESLEQAVHREVFEESSLRVERVTYIGSQPWPFPASLMVGFTATATGTEFTLDMNEVSEAMWVTRAELVAGVAAGEIVPAPHGSIARRMLEDWVGEPVVEPTP